MLARKFRSDFKEACALQFNNTNQMRQDQDQNLNNEYIDQTQFIEILKVLNFLDEYPKAAAEGLEQDSVLMARSNKDEIELWLLLL